MVYLQVICTHKSFVLILLHIHQSRSSHLYGESFYFTFLCSNSIDCRGFAGSPIIVLIKSFHELCSDLWMMVNLASQSRCLMRMDCFEWYLANNHQFVSHMLFFCKVDISISVKHFYCCCSQVWNFWDQKVHNVSGNASNEQEYELSLRKICSWGIL